MPLKTITQVRIDYPGTVIAGTDLLPLDQATRTVAATMEQVKTFVRPAEVTTTVGGLLSAADKVKLNGVAAEATKNAADADLRDRATHTGTQSILTVTGLRDQLRGKAAGSTGLLAGGAVSINSDTSKIDVALGVAVFVSYTTPEDPVSTTVSFAAVPAITLTALGTAPFTFVGVNSSGSIVQQSTPFTTTQRATIVPLALVLHGDGEAVSSVIGAVAWGRDYGNQIRSIADAIGSKVLTGCEINASTGLQVNRAAGTLFAPGAGSTTDPHRVSVTAVSNAPLIYAVPNGDWETKTAVDTGNYNLIGVVTPVPTGKWTVQTFWGLPSGEVVVEYGDIAFNSAGEAIGYADFTSPVSTYGALIGGVVVQQGSTDFASALWLARVGNMLVNRGVPAVSFPAYTLTTLPSAAANAGRFIDVTNATGGAKLCRSDGTAWKIANTTTTVT